ncbi:hypothetical protein Poly24_24490 [Rosistilla carotiformis]|uniref:DUF4256 domain-containing protein n=1 Tax=Rosistilla carotiformis TaxID=2528017 RepID=A0A518JT68_9BACT|nr:DUF4256 domain-containing protein [Rosistilla carotiformis]QDV68736.1 hypothetical protein Poly24_24490 [Rosistilla carotiformis]
MKKKRESRLDSTEPSEDLLATLQSRFNANESRHRGIRWSDVKARIDSNPAKRAVLERMERTGGEPDVVGRDKKTGAFLFFDCCAESPIGRRSVCYDREALESRKSQPPRDSVLDMAAAIGIDLLCEEQYRELQTLGDFDTKTSSWIRTPAEVRALGGALFGDFRYGQVFIYHNGAQSYYAARGFRGSVSV